MEQIPSWQSTSLIKRNNGVVKELMLVASGISLLNLVYYLPVLVAKGITVSLLKEVGMDCVFVFISCVPGWWLHFYRYSYSGVKKRILLHLLSGTIFYCLWIILYQLYNPFAGKPGISAIQILQNFGPNMSAYLQIFSLLHIYHFFRQREIQMQQEKELKELAYNGEISALKAQIQPHFLFNTLNSISASVPMQHEKTRELIARLADTFRYALTATQEDRVPLSSEIEFIQTYLSLEQQRFGKRLGVKISIDEQIADLLIPPMLLQPLVENALIHGIEPSVQGGSICISCIRLNRKVKISVANNGMQYSGSLQDMLQSGGVGLRNTSSRLEKLYQEKLQVTHESDYLCFSFFVPLVIPRTSGK